MRRFVVLLALVAGALVVPAAEASGPVFIPLPSGSFTDTTCGFTVTAQFSAGEVVKIFVVKKDPSLTEQQLIDYSKDQLAGYKRPKFVEFRTELPKTNVGKILRRELRTSAIAKVA